MKKSSLKQRLLLSVSGIGLAMSAVLGTSFPAVAQGDDESTGDLIIVTGSRIPRQDLEANSPIAIVHAEEFEFAGISTVERVLNQLPQVVPGASSQSNNPVSYTHLTLPTNREV